MHRIIRNPFQNRNNNNQNQQNKKKQKKHYNNNNYQTSFGNTMRSLFDSSNNNQNNKRNKGNNFREQIFQDDSGTTTIRVYQYGSSGFGDGGGGGDLGDMFESLFGGSTIGRAGKSRRGERGGGGAQDSLFGGGGGAGGIGDLLSALGIGFGTGKGGLGGMGGMGGFESLFGGDGDENFLPLGQQTPTSIAGASLKPNAGETSSNPLIYSVQEKVNEILQSDHSIIQLFGFPLRYSEVIKKSIPSSSDKKKNKNAPKNKKPITLEYDIHGSQGAARTAIEATLEGEKFTIHNIILEFSSGVKREISPNPIEAVGKIQKPPEEQEENQEEEDNDDEYDEDEYEDEEGEEEDEYQENDEHEEEDEDEDDDEGDESGEEQDEEETEKEDYLRSPLKLGPTQESQPPKPHRDHSPSNKKKNYNLGKLFDTDISDEHKDNN
jgi:flagellar hook-basal body complex protein FliE